MLGAGDDTAAPPDRESGPDAADPAAPSADTDEHTGAEERAQVRSRLLGAAPEAVRFRVAEIVAVAVGGMPMTDLPAPVRPVARFAPTKRARAGAAPLLSALTSADGFADQVVAWWRENRPDQWPPEPTEGAAAAALLEGRDEGADLVRDAGERADAARLRAERDAAIARADRLAADLERVTGERDEAREVARSAARERGDEITKLRSRLREQGVRVRRAEDEASAARADAESGGAGLRRELEETCRDRDRQRELTAAAEARARRAAEERDAARRSAREDRRADDARLALLVDTVAGAAAGLRHELGLREDDTGTDARPAELLRPTSGPLAARVTDPAALDRLLALPEVHLILDGYNVTKSGWPEQSLAQQRERLVQAVAPLAARTGAETTVVFDGAGVTGVPTHSVRGVRVLFSDAGELADDLIRSLVAAEPSGRALVVVTSDRAVVDSVRRRGAHPVPSSVLLERLARI